MSSAVTSYARDVPNALRAQTPSKVAITAALGVIYGAALLFLLGPILAQPIGADDTYWILISGPSNGGSTLDAFFNELARTGDTTLSQPRFAQFSYAVRRSSSIAIFELAMAWGIAPGALWTLVRAVLLAASVIVVVWFLALLRWNDRQGRESRLQRRHLIWFALALPLVAAMGATAQVVNTINGWIDYPVLTYSSVAIIFGFAGLALATYRALINAHAWWHWAGGVGAFVGLAVILNNSYEIYWVAAPLAILVVSAAAFRRATADRAARRAYWVFNASFVGAFLVNFVYYRYLVSEWDCVQSECYPGSQVALDRAAAVSIAKNLIGALPLVHRSIAKEDAVAIGMPDLPWVSVSSVVASVIAAACVVFLARRLAPRSSRSLVEPAHDGGAAHILAVVSIAGVGVALGVAIITGVNARAPELMSGSLMPYRTGYTTWLSLSLSAIAVAQLVVTKSPQWLARTLASVMLVSCVGVLAVAYPQNQVSAVANRIDPAAEVVNRIHWEASLGDPSAAGDARRCEAFEDHVRARGESSYAMRTLSAADRAFRFYHGAPFCSQIERDRVGDIIDWTG